MKPFSITAPEEIAKEYGGNKQKIQQAAAQGMIDPTSAVLAGMFIDRMRNAATAEQAPQPSIAEQVMNPQPQMPSAGLAAAPQAGQMQQPMAPRMGQPAASPMPQPAQAQMAQGAPVPPQQPRGMAMGGGLDSIDFVEQGYAPGGVVSFQVGGGYGETMQQLRNQLSAARTQAQRDQIQGAMNQLRAQYEQPSLQPNLSTGPAREGLAAVDTSDPMAIGMETFADGMVSRPDQGQRIDPNRFNTGTLTEAEARRIESGEGTGLLSGLASMFSPAETTGEVPVDRTGQRADFGGQDITMPGISAETGDRGGFSLADIYNQYAPRVRRSIMGAENQMDMPDPEGALVTGLSGKDSADVNAYQSGTGDVPGRGPLEGTTTTAGRRITDPAEIARLEATPEGRAQAASGLEDRRGTLAEQVARMRAGADSETMVGDGALRDMGRSPFGLEQPATPTDQIAAEQEKAKEAPPAADTQETPEPEKGTEELSLSDEFTAFQDKMKDIMPKNEFGEYRKKFEQMMKDTKGTMQKGRKDAFNMALLQAGLGMLGQQGGQTALQALGKAALPATKQYMDTVKGLKKEERELLKLGLSLEQMDAKEKAAATRTMANLFGQERTRQATLEAAELRRSADNKFYDEYGAEAYEKMMKDRASAGALARLPAQQQERQLDVAKFLSDAEEAAGETFDDALQIGARKKEAEALGISVQELRKRRIEEARNKALSDLRGPSPSDQGGGTQPTMESKDKNGKPIVSYDGGQNWVYK